MSDNEQVQLELLELTELSCVVVGNIVVGIILVVISMLVVVVVVAVVEVEGVLAVFCMLLVESLLDPGDELVRLLVEDKVLVTVSLPLPVSLVTEDTNTTNSFND